ncbi:MAG: dual specificity protein phosphatase family protein [Victivallales bacterium]|jgi:protein tyrosine/serine phosphatase
MIKGAKLKFFLSGIITVAVASVIAGVLWNNGLRDRLFPKRWGVVESGKICRSGKINPAIMEGVLRKNNIRIIINLTGADGLSKAESDAAGKLGVEIFSYKFLEGGLSSAEDYSEVLKKVSDSRREGKPVLIHCNAGENRTGGVVAVYRVLVEGKSPEYAYAELLRYGWKKDSMMIAHLNENMKDISALLVKNGVIDKVPDPLPQLPVRR